MKALFSGSSFFKAASVLVICGWIHLKAYWRAVERSLLFRGPETPASDKRGGVYYWSKDWLSFAYFRLCRPIFFGLRRLSSHADGATLSISRSIDTRYSSDVEIARDLEPDRLDPMTSQDLSPMTERLCGEYGNTND
jgi:hypothetical protein